MSKNYREHSRDNWITKDGNMPDTNQLALGCLQRIADATELMAQNHARLVRERDDYERYWREAQKRINQRDRQIAALRGVITRMKKKEQA